jgi:hypothetical protein
MSDWLGADVPAERLVHEIEDRADQVDVSPLGVSSDDVRLAGGPSPQHGFDGDAVILDVEPVADVRAFAVYRHGTAVRGVGDHERDELLRKLVRPVVIRAVRDDDG